MVLYVASTMMLVSVSDQLSPDTGDLLQPEIICVDAP